MAHFWKIIWRTKVPLRAAFVAWTITLGKILTMDELRKRHNHDRLVSIDHFPLHCEIANSQKVSSIRLDWLGSCSEGSFLVLEKARWQPANCTNAEDGPIYLI